MLITHNGAVFSPDGKVNVLPESVTETNNQINRIAVEYCKTGPERITAYVNENPQPVFQVDDGGAPKPYGPAIVTWLGTELGRAWIGPKRRVRNP